LNDIFDTFFTIHFKLDFNQNSKIDLNSHEWQWSA
jgi:hypothetical protein